MRFVRQTVAGVMVAAMALALIPSGANAALRRFALILPGICCGLGLAGTYKPSNA